MSFYDYTLKNMVVKNDQFLKYAVIISGVASLSLGKGFEFLAVLTAFGIYSLLHLSTQQASWFQERLRSQEQSYAVKALSYTVTAQLSLCDDKTLVPDALIELLIKTKFTDLSYNTNPLKLVKELESDIAFMSEMLANRVRRSAGELEKCLPVSVLLNKGVYEKTALAYEEAFLLVNKYDNPQAAVIKKELLKINLLTNKSHDKAVSVLSKLLRVSEYRSLYKSLQEAEEEINQLIKR